MLSSPRIFVAALCFALHSVAATPRSEEALVGTWRSDDGQVVEEYAFRDDHTFTSWLQAKGAVLHTPGVIIETGVWSRNGERLTITPEKTNSLKPSQPLTLRQVRVSGDLLIATGIGEKQRVSLRRLDLPVCASAAEGALDIASIDKTLLGTWQMHLNTHDYVVTFHEDHSFTASARIEGEPVDVPSGVWRLDGDKLIVDLEKRKGNDEQRGFRWSVVGLKRDCVALRDGTMQVTLGRLP